MSDGTVLLMCFAGPTTQADRSSSSATDGGAGCGGPERGLLMPHRVLVVPETVARRRESADRDGLSILSDATQRNHRDFVELQAAILHAEEAIA